MKSPTGWEKRLFNTLFITLFLFIMTQTPASAFGPAIVDVTTKAFSVVWTTGGSYTSCGINVYTSGSYSTEMALDSSQTIVETAPGNPGQEGKAYRIAKVTVVGLDVNKQYWFRVVENGTERSGNYTVTTERLRGLDNPNPDESDIVSNDIVHKGVYKPDGTSPAIGALVLAEIYAHGSNPDTDPTLTDYPISAWVGDGMIGGESTQYNPDNISYRQYAALNMNNIYGKDHYTLSLHGDDPETTTINESEIIKFTIVHGTQSILGGGTGDSFTSYGRVEYTEKASGEKITTAKVSASFLFKKGLNMFTLPFSVLEGYSTGDLLQDIEEAEGGAKIVYRIYIYKGGWEITKRGLFGISNSLPLNVNDGCFIELLEDMTNEVAFYGTPNSTTANLSEGLNLLTFPQTPDYYETGDLLGDIESDGGAGTKNVLRVYFYEGGWDITKPGLFGVSNSKPMSNMMFYFVTLKAGAQEVIEWDPWE